MVVNVEADKTTRTQRSCVLLQAGFAVAEAATSQEALVRASEAGSERLLVLALPLPDLADNEAALRFRRHPALSGVPVLWLLPEGSPPAAPELSDGIQESLVRPVGADTLVSAVERLLRRRPASASPNGGLGRLLQRVGITSYFVLDREWRLSEASSTLGGKLASIPAEVPIWQAVPETAGSLIEEICRRCREQASPVEMEGVCPLNRRWARMCAMPWGEGVAVTVIDLDDWKKLEEGYRRRCADAEEEIAMGRERERELRSRNEELQQFSFALSHDLQEPLRIVSGFARRLATQYQTLKQSEIDEFFGYVLDASDRMLAMIGGLMAYCREMHEGSAESTPIELDQVLRWALSNLQTAIQESGAEVTFDPLPRVLGDFGALARLLQNLIGNALKYRGAELPRIHISARRDNGDWIVAVRDNGLGFDPSASRSVFRPLVRLHGRQYPGSGMGLAICRNIVERHGGRIWAESVPGTGSTFYFSVPDPG